MRRAAVAFGVAIALGAAGLGALGLIRGSDLVYSTGTQLSTPVAVLKPRGLVCQQPIRPPSGTSFDRVSFSLGTYKRTGEPVRVLVRDADRHTVLGSGRLAGGYADVDRQPVHVVGVGRVAADAALEVCLRNEGARRVAVYGQADFTAPHSTATLNGRPLNADVAIALRTHERSLLSLLPEMAERAARFRAGWVTPAVYAVLALLLVVAAPLLLARGVARAAAEDGA